MRSYGAHPMGTVLLGSFSTVVPGSSSHRPPSFLMGGIRMREKSRSYGDGSFRFIFDGGAGFTVTLTAVIFDGRNPNARKNA